MNKLSNDEIIISESNQAILYREQKKYSKAYKCIEKVIKLGRNDGWVYSEAGLNLYGLEQYEKALANFVAKLPILNQFNKVRWNIVWYYKGIANNLCFIGINISNFTNDKQYNNTRTN